MSHIADQVEWRSLADGASGLEFTAEAGDKDRVRQYFEGLTRSLEMLHYTVDEFIADGDRVAVLCSTAWRNPATGKSFDPPKLDMFTIDDGQTVEFFEFYDTATVAAK